MTLKILTYVMCLMVTAALLLEGVPPAPDVGTGDGAHIRPRKLLPANAMALAMAPPGMIARGRKRKRGAIYARFSTRFQASIDDQVRACREWCDANEVDVDDDDDMIFIDRATSGKKSRRAGLDKLKAALNAKKIDVLVAFTTNRLHRNSYKARQFIEEEVVENGVRCVCIRSGVDTADEKKWRTLHSVNAIVDEMMLTSTADAVRNAHAGALLQKLVAGRLPPGYTGKPIEGRLTRMQRPKRELIIDPIRSEWVKKVFVWCLDENMSIVAIVARLIREGAPGTWTQQIVRGMLSNERYTGHWAYGNTRTRWLNKKDYGLQEKQEQPLQQAYFPDLRIIDDATFQAVQAKLAGRNYAGGARTKAGERRPRILNGLLWCALHDRPLNRGDGFFCPECRRSSDAGRLYSEISTDVAIRAICRALAKAVASDVDLVVEVINAFKRQADGAQRPDISRLPELQRQKEKLTRGIAVLQKNMGETDEDIAESEKSLREKRSERAVLDAEIAKLNALAGKPVRVPSETDVQRVILELDKVLLFGAKGEAAADPQALHDVIELLTGGKIICAQRGEAKAKRGWIRGTFTLRLVRSVSQQMGGDGDGGDETADVDLVDPTEAELLADQAKALYDEDLPVKLIAKHMGKRTNLIRGALDHWFHSRGLVREDGRKRRSRLPIKHLDTPLYQKIADQVHLLAEQGMLFQQIARKLDVDRNTVTQSWKFWHTSRGLVAPTGHLHRKAMSIKNEKPYERRHKRQPDQHHRPAA